MIGQLRGVLGHCRCLEQVNGSGREKRGERKKGGERRGRGEREEEKGKRRGRQNRWSIDEREVRRRRRWKDSNYLDRDILKGSNNHITQNIRIISKHFK